MFCRAIIAVTITVFASFAGGDTGWITAASATIDQLQDEEIHPFDKAVAEAKKAMAASPMAALKHAQRAETLAPEVTRPGSLASSLWLQGEALTRLNQPQDALPIISRALRLLNNPSSQLAGDLALSMGRIERSQGDVGKALQSFQSAYRVFEGLGETRSQAIALQSIGTLYAMAYQHDRVIDYNLRASDVFSDGAILDLVSLNNRANAFRALDRFDEAVAMFNEALTMAEESGSALLQVRILTNIAVTQVKREDYAAADEAIERGFSLANSAETQGWLPFLWGAKAELACALQRGDDALYAINMTFNGVDPTTTTGPFRDFHETAFKVYSSFGRYQEALTHLSAFKRLDDEGREVAASANNALINTEFEVANKELQIERLRADQLEQEAELSRSREELNQVVRATVLIIIMSLIAFFAYSYRAARRFGNATKKQNKELSDANLALQDANQAKLEFLAVTSHEIRTPLNAIIGLSDVLLTTRHLEEKDNEFISMINKAGAHLLDVVNDILDVSKLEAGRLTIYNDPTDIAALVEDVAAIWKRTAEDKGLQFNIDVEKNMGSFLTDSRLIRQTLSNLLSNAIKFTADGAVSITCRRSTSMGFVINVQDTGIGIAQDQCAVVFEAFRQADGRKQRNYGGTGLGLAICKRIAETLGGNITLDSTLGKGTVFTLCIPAEQASDQTATQQVLGAGQSSDQHAATDQDLENLKILVAEDNQTNAMVIRAYLARDKAAVTIVENGLLAVEAVQSGDFDVVLMDKQMPVLDGYAATRAIRELAGSQSTIPIIAVTADAFEESTAEALRHGMDDFVSKPINPSVLRDTIIQTLATKKAERAINLRA
ncbi:MAG: ATP-binding protein [Pseudomonadota bacterium]